ncbi:MAG: branched-chain amino acid ABC transporter permease [Methylobacteriaceae bacterium]|nr:branched-chain amino acid ABC transporter permease [Methylobacteriaceae bacterium]
MTRIIPIVAFASAVVAPLLIRSDSTFAIITFGFLLASLAVSFNLIFGFTGQLSFFHAAAFGVAAYMTAILVSDYGWSFWAAIVPALLAVGLLALAVGAICFRFKLREFYFAVVTMAFSEMIRLVVVNWNSVTNGTLGMTVTAQPTLWLPTGSISLTGARTWYYVALLILVATYIICHRVLASWIGRCFAAIRLNEQLGETLGVNIFMYKLLSFVLGSTLAGLTGCFYGFYTGFIEPQYLSITQSLDIVAMVLLGGVNSLFGPVIGGMLLTALPHAINLTAELRIILYGAILIFVIIVMPSGIFGLFSRPRHAV